MDSQSKWPLHDIFMPLADMDTWMEGQRTVNAKGAEFREQLSGNRKDEKFTGKLLFGSIKEFGIKGKPKIQGVF